MSTSPKPRLLAETAEIALTEIKRTFESKLAETFQLRRVSAPLYLPVDSGLCGDVPSLKLTIEGADGPEEVEIVTSLDKWCRSKLADYDIAPGFGLFTVMNALRPSTKVSTTSSPHIDGWAWEMSLHSADRTADTLISSAKKLYNCVLESQRMITEKFPHRSPMLPEKLHVAQRSESFSETELEVLTREHRAVLLIGADPMEARADVDQWDLSASLVGWNNLTNQAVAFSRLGVRVNPESLRRQATASGHTDLLSLPFQKKVLDGELPDAIGGFVSRKHLAMLLLHQVSI